VIKRVSSNETKQDQDQKSIRKSTFVGRLGRTLGTCRVLGRKDYFSGTFSPGNFRCLSVEALLTLKYSQASVFFASFVTGRITYVYPVDQRFFCWLVRILENPNGTGTVRISFWIVLGIIVKHGPIEAVENPFTRFVLGCSCTCCN